MSQRCLCSTGLWAHFALLGTWHAAATGFNLSGLFGVFGLLKECLRVTLAGHPGMQIWERILWPEFMWPESLQHRSFFCVWGGYPVACDADARCCGALTIADVLPPEGNWPGSRRQSSGHLCPKRWRCFSQESLDLGLGIRIFNRSGLMYPGFC
jgi:hypothetical protein